jgi:hypothetical protein
MTYTCNVCHLNLGAAHVCHTYSDKPVHSCPECLQPLFGVSLASHTDANTHLILRDMSGNLHKLGKLYGSLHQVSLPHHVGEPLHAYHQQDQDQLPPHQQFSPMEKSMAKHS